MLKKRRLARMSRRKRVLRRVGLLFTWLLGLFALLVTVVAFGVYSVAHVPSPDELRTNQTAVLEYSDGSTMATIDNGENRTDVPLSRCRPTCGTRCSRPRTATSTQNRGSRSGARVRAAVNDLRGGSTQGGSTITQQYVKNAYLSSDQTLSRKIKELAISLKLSREYSKDDILDDYLNTIYFGRRAYGIEAAAQGLLRRGRLQGHRRSGRAAGRRDQVTRVLRPGNHAGGCKGRWDYVVDGMVSTGKLTQAQRNVLKFPTTIKTPSINSVLDGPLGLVWRQVKAELSADGIDPASINTKGLRIQTTIDKNAQSAAQSAIASTYSHLTAKQQNLRPALVATDPNTGGVIAYYGGSNGTGLDYAQSWRPPVRASSPTSPPRR